MKNKKVSLILAIVFFVASLTFDLVSKYVIVSTFLPQEGMSMDFLPGFINFETVYNDGGAANILSGKRIFLILSSVLIISALLFFYIRRFVKKDKLSKTLGVAVGLITGGCIGNLYDRIFIGAVRDFINFQFFKFYNFNIADSAICIGIAILFIYFIFIYPNEDKKKSPDVKEEK